MICPVVCDQVSYFHISITYHKVHMIPSTCDPIPLKLGAQPPAPNKKNTPGRYSFQATASAS